MANPFDQFDTSAPAVIYGKPDTSKAEADARLRDEAARKAELDAIKTQSEQIKLQQAKTANAVTGGVDASVDQGKSAAFAERAQGALKNYESQNLDPDSLVGRAASGVFPRGTAMMSSDKRNAVRAAEREFIASVLRYDSGAAIPPSEFSDAYEIYFPSPNAGPEEIKQKAEARRRAIQGLLIGAGPAAARVGQAQAAAETPQANRLSKEQQDKIFAFINAGNRTPEEVAAYYSEITGGGQLDPERTKQALARVAKGEPVGGVDYSIADAQAKAAAEAEAAKVSAVDGAPGLGTLGTQGITLGLSDEAAGLGKAIAGMFQGGDGSFADNYTLGRDAERIRIEQARQNTGALGTAAEIGSGLLSGGASVLTGPIKAVAAGGGIAGFGYGDGAANSTTNALLGAGGGAVLAKGMGVVGNRLASRAPRNSLLPDVAQAAQAEGVRVGRPIVDPSVRAKMGALESTPGGSNVVREGLQQTSSDVEAAVGRLGRNRQALDNVVAGEKVQDAGRRTMQQTKTVVDRLYKRAEGMSAGVKADPKNAVAILDQNLAELGQAPETNAAVIRFLEGLKSDLSNGPLSIDTIRQIRSGIRGSISEKNLSFSDAERRAMQVLDAASQDIETALGSNPQALQAYKLADARYRQRREYIDQVLSPILGKRDNPLSGEKAFAKIQAMASPKGNSRQMASLWKSLTPDEASDVAATMAANLGRDAAGEFSPARFVSQVSRLSPQARRVAFGPDGTRSIENLVKISDAYSAASKDINWSRSGAVRNYRELLRDVVLGGGGGGALSMVGGGSGATTAIMAAGAAGAAAGGKAIANNLSAKTLMNPQFAKWLANAPNTTSARAIDQHFSQLAKIAASNPAMATEVNGLRQMLIEAVSKSPGRATASEDKQN